MKTIQDTAKCYLYQNKSEWVPVRTATPLLVIAENDFIQFRFIKPSLAG